MYDSNNNWLLSLDEFKELYCGEMSGDEDEEEEESNDDSEEGDEEDEEEVDPEELFEEFDADDNMTICLDEFSIIYHFFLSGYTDKTQAELLYEFDEDGDGCLCLHEFK